jgi:hypothetical protein
MSGDGISAYSGSGDVITNPGSGANGMDNTSAWFRIEDPGSLREYVFKRSSSHITWVWQYSASAGFTGGTPNHNTIPTATDMVGLASQSSAAQTMFKSGAKYICHMAAQDTAEGGVYGWYLLVLQPNSTAFYTIMMCEPMDNRYNPGGADTDPCVHVGSDDTDSYANWSAVAATGPNDWAGYMDHGGGGEEHDGISSLYGATSASISVPGNMGANPHTSRWPILPIYWVRHSSSGVTTGFKGMSKFLKWKPMENSTIAFKYPLVATDTANGVRYVVWEDVMIPGWPANIDPEV